MNFYGNVSSRGDACEHLPVNACEVFKEKCVSSFFDQDDGGCPCLAYKPMTNFETISFSPNRKFFGIIKSVIWITWCLIEESVCKFLVNGSFAKRKLFSSFWIQRFKTRCISSETPKNYQLRIWSCNRMTRDSHRHCGTVTAHICFGHS